MKRTFALVALLAALGVLSKLAFKPVRPPNASGSSHGSVEYIAPVADQAGPDPRAELIERYRNGSAQQRELVERVADRYRQTAAAIERTDGLRGLVLLDRLDLEAIFLYEKYPKEFHRLREMLGDEAAADLLLHWREYFGLKRSDETDRGTLIAELGNLTPGQRRAASKYPGALPLILAEPNGVTELIERHRGDEAALSEALAVLSLISLENGASDIRAALRTIDDHRTLALDAFRQFGLEGFALVSLHGPVLDALGTALPLDQALILLKVNSDYVDEFLKTHRPETLALHLRHVAAVGLADKVGGNSQALRLAVEFGERGEQALIKAGPDAAEVVYGDFTDQTLRSQAVAALGEHGAMALAMLDKYATDPDFREILRTYGAAVIPPVAQADAGQETLALLQSKTRRTFTESLAKAALFASGDSGQAVIRTIKTDGLERVAHLASGEIQFYQFLPLYDVLHLGNVLRRGHAPTSGELTWALVDGCFVVADVLSLAAIQPEGAVAAEAIRSEVKAALREGTKSVGRELAEAGGESAGKGLSQTALEGTETVSRQLARWWTVRSAGGVYQVLRRFPQALPLLSLTQMAEIARPLCARAGMRLTTWKPFHLLRDGIEVTFRIPPERGLKYLSAQMLQAGVGVVGFQKMEEHLASRRPHRP